MNRMYYLSIQGKYAPSFWFKNQDAQNFRSLIESITLSNTLLISSIYRSDLFFNSEEDKTDLVIRTWCTFKNYHYDEHVKSKFIRASKIHNAFEIYFDTLFHLMLHQSYYERYRSRLHEIQRLEKNNPILNELLQCDVHMSECYKDQQVHYIKLSPKTGEVTKGSLAYESFDVLAREKLNGLNFN